MVGIEEDVPESGGEITWQGLARHGLREIEAEDREQWKRMKKLLVKETLSGKIPEEEIIVFHTN